MNLKCFNLCRYFRMFKRRENGFSLKTVFQIWFAQHRKSSNIRCVKKGSFEMLHSGFIFFFYSPYAAFQGFRWHTKFASTSFWLQRRNVFQTLQVKLSILRILTGLFVLTKSTDISLSRPTMVWRNASHNVGETAHWVWVQCMHCTGSNVQRLSRCSELHSKQPPPHSGIAKIGRPASVWTGIYLCMPLIKRLPCTRTGTAVLATDDPPFIHHLSELLPRLSSGLRVPFAACVTHVCYTSCVIPNWV